MTREQMQDQLNKSFGHKDDRVVWFRGLCEKYPENEWNNKCLEGIFSALLDLAQYSAELDTEEYDDEDAIQSALMYDYADHCLECEEMGISPADFGDYINL